MNDDLLVGTIDEIAANLKSMTIALIAGLDSLMATWQPK